MAKSKQANKSEFSQFTSVPNIDEFAKLQFEQAVETFRTQFSLFIQITTLIGLADVTIIGYAISGQISGILLVGSLFPLAIIYVRKRVYNLMVPVAYVAVCLEQKYGDKNIDWLATTFALHAGTSGLHIKDLMDIVDIADKNERIKKLRNFKITFRKSYTHLGLILITLAQLIIPIILSFVFNWRLF